MKKVFNLIAFIFASLCFLYLSPPANASTTVSGSIYENTTWTLANSPYVVQGILTVEQGAMLTIEPGVVVKSNPTSLFSGIFINGILSAIGTSEMPIYFTSIKDDSVGGDTNGDGSTTTPAPQDWTYIYVYTNGSAIFSNVSIKYAGGSSSLNRCYCALVNNGGFIFASDSKISDSNAAGIRNIAGSSSFENCEFSNNETGIWLENGIVDISKNNIHNNSYNGIWAENGVLNVTDNAFENNAIYSARIDGSVNFSHSGNTATGSQRNGFAMYETLLQSQTWSKDNIPYIIDEAFTVPVGVTLSLQEGSIIKFLYLRFYNYFTIVGTLNANGTKDNKIYFTSIKDDSVGGDTNGDGSLTLPTSQDWQGITFSNGSEGNINHSVIRYGGSYTGFNLCNCALVNFGGNVNLSYVKISDTSGNGIRQWGGLMNITDSEIINNNLRGIWIEGGTANISQSSIYNNLYYGIQNISQNIVTAKHNWWGNVSGPYHQVLNPSGTGNNVSDNVTFVPWMGYDPTKPRPTLSEAKQYKQDAFTEISEGEFITEDSVIFKAKLNSTENKKIKLQVELKEFEQNFDESDIIESDFVDSENIASIQRFGLVEGKYKWRARAVDEEDISSLWREFGTAGNVDFEITTSLGNKAAALAKDLINQPYLWGGKGWDFHKNMFVSAQDVKTGYNFHNSDTESVDFGKGVDCSGLVMWSYNRSFDPTKSIINNYVKYENANGQYLYNTEPIEESDLKPGDVLFFDNLPKNGYIDHVAMYVGENSGFNIVHAANRNQGIIVSNTNIMKSLSRFNSFGKITSASPIAMVISSHSPVDISVTDPNGFTITPTTKIESEEEYIREIPGILYYSEMEIGEDGKPIDRIYSPILKQGDYIINVIPENGTSPDETYSIDFATIDQTIPIADNIPINQIPNQGYGITIGTDQTISKFIPVLIDIKPENDENVINLKSKGVIPVVIFGSETFEVNQIDTNTIKLGEASIKTKGNGENIVSNKDQNSDGFTDMLIKISTEELELNSEDTEAVLEGQLFDGTIIKGSDSVKIIR